MQDDILSKLLKFTQYKGIPYVADFRCPECDECALYGGDDAYYNHYMEKPNLVGWCETEQGYMMVFECTKCFAKFRCHCNTGDKFDKENFENSIFEIVSCDIAIHNSESMYYKLFGDC